MLAKGAGFQIKFSSQAFRLGFTIRVNPADSHLPSHEYDKNQYDAAGKKGPTSQATPQNIKAPADSVKMGQWLSLILRRLASLVRPTSSR